MNFTTLSGDSEFWNSVAPWYEKWISRNEYHRLIISEISHMIEPGWKVLDIGAGTGGLSIPLSALGCEVSALEPIREMRGILKDKVTSLNIGSITVFQENWNEFNDELARGYNLIIACNSMHLVPKGFMNGMSKVFHSLPSYICLVTEINKGISFDFKEIDRMQDSYNFLYIKNIAIDSSFYFRNDEEVTKLECLMNKKIHTIRRNDQIVQPDSTDVAVLWWEKNNR